MGCGLSICHNKQCVKGGHAKLSSNEAAAQALKFLKEQAQICEIFGKFLIDISTQLSDLRIF